MPPYGELAATLAMALVAGLIALGLAHSVPVALVPNWAESPRLRRWIDLAVYGLITGFLVIYAWLDIGKYESFNVYGLDFSLFDQVVWNSLHGRLYENTLLQGIPIILGQHSSFILVALVPLYALFADPRVLIVMPVVCVALAALPLYWIARKQIGPGLAFIVVAAFLLGPGIQRMALSQFYEIMLALPLLVLIGSFLVKRRIGPFLLCLPILLLCKEDIPLITAGFGLYLLFIQRKYLLGSAITLSSLVWFFILIQYVLPFFQHSSSYFYFQEGGYGNGQYNYLGTSLSDVIRTILTRPDVVAPHVFQAVKIDTVLKLVIPLGLLPLAGPEVLALAFPTLAYTLLSDRETQYVLGSHHYSAVFPFLLLATIVGIARISRWVSAKKSNQVAASVRVGLGVYLLVAAMVNYYLYSTGPLSQGFSPERYTPTQHAMQASSLAATIPSDASAIAQMELLPHVSQREKIYAMPGFPCLTSADYIFADLTRPWYGYVQGPWNEALSASYFQTVAEQDGIILKKRVPFRGLQGDAQTQFGDGMTLLGYTVPLTQTATGGQGLHVLLEWNRTSAAPVQYEIRLELTDAQGHLWSAQQYAPCQNNLPKKQTTDSEILDDDLVLKLPPTMPSGDYHLSLSLFDQLRDQFVLLSGKGSDAGTNLLLQTLPVQKNQASYSASQLQIEQPLFVDMAEIRFLGYVPPRRSLHPGEAFQVGIYWRARGEPKGDYSVAVQLRDSAGKVAFEQSARPANGQYPTTLWKAGEVLLDWHDFDLPPDLALGDYRLYALLRDVVTGRQLGEASISDVSIVP